MRISIHKVSRVFIIKEKPMKKAFWFDGEHLDVQNNRAFTENGATGYRTTTKALLDLNFRVSSLRDRDEEHIVKEFIIE